MNLSFLFLALTIPGAAFFLLLAMAIPAAAHDDCDPSVTTCDATVDRAAELSNALNFYAAGYRDGGEIARLVLGWGPQDDERELEMKREQRRQH